MSTATIDMTPGSVLFQRFVWKEYRMLRGFWLAVGGLGLLMQLVSAQTVYDRNDLPGMLFAVAWGTAAFYAIGAAVTLFSAEREEQTRDFLMLLPGRWLPMLVGKVSIAIVSSLALAVALAGTGWLIGGSIWPKSDEFMRILVVGGVAVLEATAWGLLFSLWLKQPLLAAVAAIAAASIGAQLAVAATPNASVAVTLASYRDAVPMRLLLLLAVFAADIYLGAHWLRGRQSSSKKLGLLSLWGRSITAENVATTSPSTRKGVMVRLLWQTWRESWKTMLAAVPIGLLLMFGVSLPFTSQLLSNGGGAHFPIPLLTLLFLPALFGALSFRADLRGDHRQFLLAHVVGPRYIWLARHLFWGAGLLAMTMAVSAAIWVAVSLEVQGDIHRIFRDGYSGNFSFGVYLENPLDEPWRLVSLLDQLLGFALQFTWMSWTSIFTAYALGQFCSLMLRREVLAGLLALIASVLLVAWVLVCQAWQLSFWWFVMPIGLGAMLATWLRMPNWIVGRNRPRTWVLPILALAVPIGFVLSMVPSTRLAQLEGLSGQTQIAEEARLIELDRAEGEATALDYERLFRSLPGTVEADANLIAELIEISQRPECRFTVLLDSSRIRSQIDLLSNTSYLLSEEARRLESQGDLDDALGNYLAVVRLQGHILRHQPTRVVSSLLYYGSMDFMRWNPDVQHMQIEDSLLAWAQHPDQTSELLRKAVVELEKCPELIADVREAILADWRQVRAVVQGEELPQELWGWPDTLALLANELPWEKERSLQALDIRMNQILDHVLTAVDDPTPAWHGIAGKERRKILSLWYEHIPQPYRLVYGNDWGEYSQATQNAMLASTSYLVNREFQQRMEVRSLLIDTMATKVRRYGLITQLALLAYRFDHQQYPETLAELSPEYLSEVPLDPYSDSLLEYRPQGFGLPMRSYWKRSDFEVKLIPKNTPVLWSVGVGNLEPRESSIPISQIDPNIPTAHWDSEEETETIEVIKLVRSKDALWSLSPIVFALPKIETLDSPADDKPEEEKAAEVEE